MILQIDPIVKSIPSTFEKIQNPILILLIVVLVSGLYFSYRYFTGSIKLLQDTIKEKDSRIEQQHNLLVDVRSSDAALVVELTNTLDKFVDADKAYCDKLGSSNELLNQLNIKIDILLKITGK